jgi:hypothetical protein
MKVTFTTPVVEEDITRTGITVDHIIIYPGSQIVLNNKGGSNRTLMITGLSKVAQAAFATFVSALSGEANDEYVSGAVTARAQAAAIAANPDQAPSPIVPAAKPAPPVHP